MAASDHLSPEQFKVIEKAKSLRNMRINQTGGRARATQVKLEALHNEHPWLSTHPQAKEALRRT